MTDPFFIVGSSRSGTTLMSRILKRNANIHVLNETHFFEEFSHQILTFKELTDDQLYRMVNAMITIQRKDYYRKSEYEEYPDQSNKIMKEFDQLNNRSFETLNKIFFNHEARNLGKMKSGDQTPRHVFYVNEIFAMYPGAKVINLVRDPRAVLFSQKKKWASGLRRKQPLFEVVRTFLNYHPITMSMLWCKAVKAGMSAKNHFGEQKIKTLLFEDLVKNPDFHVKNICEFLGEVFNPSMLDVAVELSATPSQEGQKGVNNVVSTQWQRELSSSEIFFCEKIAGKFMEEFGFPLIGQKPNWGRVILYSVWFPLHLGVAFIINLNRMGNPIKFIIKRFF